MSTTEKFAIKKESSRLVLNTSEVRKLKSGLTDGDIRDLLSEYYLSYTQIDAQLLEKGYLTLENFLYVRYIITDKLEVKTANFEGHIEKYIDYCYSKATNWDSIVEYFLEKKVPKEHYDLMVCLGLHYKFALLEKDAAFLYIIYNKIVSKPGLDIPQFINGLTNLSLLADLHPHEMVKQTLKALYS